MTPPPLPLPRTHACPLYTHALPKCLSVLIPPGGRQAFSEGDVRFLICTDVAARGIDIKGLPYVVNMTLPDESENYIHRIGGLVAAPLVPAVPCLSGAASFRSCAYATRAAVLVCASCLGGQVVWVARIAWVSPYLSLRTLRKR